ncbi:FAD:protein FMN transferase [Sphingopyxis sp. BSN-002]|uniref:FAD:protein FMN transferase n=1 Tax=Sphingopyxis sp. BSN-002 TaxID=2911495 RepID=UPI001EDB5597|nr:FAD:protein FMN transferase [Sphingopyxis sp. BSN-002]UKK84653.1 FAD:protein FMN transferase [Sphingopyxis sp. BSN-002]
MTPAAFAARVADADVRSFAGETMGTSWSLQAVSAPSDAGVGVQAALDLVVAQMSQWEPESDISRFNRAPAGEWRVVPSEFGRVVAAALEIAEASGGAFDPSLGELTERWGFGSAGPVDAPPDESSFARCAVEIDSEGLRIRRGEGAQLDLSGIAKGYGVDLAAEWLLGQGVRHFLIEVGGELRGEGLRPDGQPWWVDVEMPPTSSIPPWRIALHDLSVATSGNYRRGFATGGRYYSHSFDPQTGRPIVNGVSSVTVLDRSCMMADGWATALTVLGPKDAMALADAQGLAASMVAGDREYCSREWRAMLG